MSSVSVVSRQPLQTACIQEHSEAKKESSRPKLESKQVDSNPLLTDSHLKRNIVNRGMYRAYPIEAENVISIQEGKEFMFEQVDHLKKQVDSFLANRPETGEDRKQLISDYITSLHDQTDSLVNSRFGTDKVTEILREGIGGGILLNLRKAYDVDLIKYSHVRI